MKKFVAIRFSRFVKTGFFLLVSFFLYLPANAQCAMCRAALSGEGNKVKAAAVNDGIVYLMVIPYLLVGAIGYAVYRMRKNKS
ncbi:hypothetical protein ACM55H_08040 [Flavobacterium sp. ZT3R17]|uniref:hypothetical protein n=1 Tax=Flavobacterium cryoconiti TaxID=3398736 RepID=UPI003A88730A